MSLFCGHPRKISTDPTEKTIAPDAVPARGMGGDCDNLNGSPIGRYWKVAGNLR
jgi:hypothetical protein